MTKRDPYDDRACKLVGEAIGAVVWRCCTNWAKDSLQESSMIAGKHEQLGPYAVQDDERVGLQ